MAKIKRSQVKSFLNTGSTGTPTWSLIGEGVVTGTINMNPKTTEETYIHEDTASISVDSYAPTMPVEMTAASTDAAFEWLDDKRKLRSILGDVETEVVNVWLWKTGAGGYYYAEKQPVSISFDTFGGDGGSPAKLNYTINYIGAATAGVFDPANLVFEANPVTTILTALACSGVTLVPTFASDKSNLLYTASVVNATSSTNMTSTLAGATITQRVGSDTVNQGAGAALAEGVNHLTVTVVVGSATSVYRIDITRATA